MQARESTVLCPCGSGLQLTSCCELDDERLRQTAPEMPKLIAQAQEALQSENTAEAERQLLAILEQAPTQPQALAMLFQLRKRSGQLRAAEALIRRLVKIKPNMLWAAQELALLLFDKRDLKEAELHARNCVRLGPKDAQSHNLMGLILTEANRPQLAEYHYRQVLELLQKPSPIVFANLAWNLKNQGRMEESRQFYEKSVQLDDSILPTLLGWAQMEETDRQFERAGELLDKAEALAPNNRTILLARAVLQGRQKDYPAALATLQTIERHSADGELSPGEWAERGRLLDKMEHYEEAFAAFSAGKKRLRELSGHAYRAQFAERLVRRLKGFFTKARYQSLPRAGVRSDTPQPLFIVGFPRSGTTMVEQTLASHSQISAGDELPLINDLTALLPRMFSSPLHYPEALADLWLADQREGLDNLRDYYLQRARQLGVTQADKRWFTDKMPLNETHLGLISLIFPRSPIVHVLRHPLDVVVSVYSNLLTHGFYCAYSLESAARHYVLIADLVEHYKQQLPLNYLAIRYEDIVEDQEAGVRKMLDFIGEPFEADCLSFHENRRYARTASYAQVTEKLYDRSRYRYRNYLKQLEPVLPILEPTITRLGYRIEE